MSIYIYLFIVCNRLPLIKFCLYCFLDIHLFSNNLSTMTTFFSLNLSELFPACLSRSNNFNICLNSLRSDGKVLYCKIL